ncbi:alpha/beta hydrolase [Kaistia dalseonensis]|uniref:Lysophospholipase n=1 Tax=Kaistia dalseonensis TaxID=410840 RepID=A0ABU0HBS5_9HYPH|nr:alpha/beta hydrolase [Kaistia dalseonensis]MCX5496811.1 alpha/beta hydrolase [Kaistia dalseonensis]MDQ0439437.1 lysophospholipase [Kaistia dalseonensis]
MNLPSFPDNPTPEGIVAQPVLTSDGVRLRSAVWRPAGPVRGTICLFQGRAETIEKYFEVVHELLERNFAVAALDWRGQGGSERRLRNPKKGHVDDFIEYERDVEAFMQQVVLPDCPPPYFALAHSTGGLVLLRVARRSRLAFTRMVLVSPLLDLGAMNPPRKFVNATCSALSLLGLGDAFPPAARLARLEARGFEGNQLTGDARRFARTVAIGKTAPTLTIGPPTIGWLSAACRAMIEAEDPAFAASVKIPTLIVAGSEDRVVSPLAIERFVREMRLGSQIMIPGARHEIMMEREPIRELFWAAFDAFIPGSED